MSNLCERISAALSDEGNLTSLKIRDFSVEISEVMAKLEPRLKNIGPEGNLYTQIALNGTSEELAAIKEEYRLGELEMIRLRARQQALFDAQRRVKVRECRRDLPENLRQLTSRIHEAESLRQKLIGTLTEVNAAYETFWRTRKVVAGNGGNAIAASEQDMQLLMSFRPMAEKTHRVFHIRDFQLAAELGLISPD